MSAITRRWPRILLAGCLGPLLLTGLLPSNASAAAPAGRTAATSFVTSSSTAGAVRPTATGQDAADPNFTVQSVSLGRSSVAVAGLNVVKVPVTLRATYVDDPDASPQQDATVILSRTSRDGTQIPGLSAAVRRTSTGSAPATWTGVLLVPSTAHGAFTVTGVLPRRSDLNDGMDHTQPTPYAGPAFNVTGTHQPRMTARILPDPFRRRVDSTYRFLGRVVDADTRAPYRHAVTVRLWIDASCPGGVKPASCTTSSTSDGRFVFTVRNNSSLPAGYQFIDMTQVAYLQSMTTDILRQPEIISRVGALLRRQAAVSARPSTVSIATGRSFTVDGRAWEVPEQHRVAIQKLRGSTQWRTVATGPVRASGRYTVAVPTSVRGRGVYRAYVAGGRTWTAAASSVLTVTAH